MSTLTIVRSLGRRGTLALVALAIMGAMAYGVTAALAQEAPRRPRPSSSAA